jgi:hypothetical protein
MGYQCEICKDTGVTPSGKECVCILQKKIGLYLPTSLKGVTIDSFLKTYKVQHKVMKTNFYFSGKSFTIGNKIVQPKVLIKLIMVHQILAYGVTSIREVTGMDVFYTFMDDDMNSQHQLMNTPVLILNIGSDYNNKFMKEIIPFLLRTRTSNPNQQTIVCWDNKQITDSQLKKKFIIDRYDEDTYNQLISSFVIADKALIIKNQSIGVK